ncbi:MAG: LPS assembly lipoprotein LptE [Lentisphaeria bacterium]|nr:LPS assembly lipoprotein LptE [Lentisphaeria bacterium]
MKILRNIIICSCTLLVSLCTGCYHIGSMMHPDVKSIAVAPVVNETTAYNASMNMRKALLEQFMRDGSLKLVNQKAADCIMYGRIINVDVVMVINDQEDHGDTYIPQEWKATVKYEFSVIIPGRKEPLVSKREVSGSANFQVQADMNPNQLNGIYAACQDAAYNAVVATTEAW